MTEQQTQPPFAPAQPAAFGGPPGAPPAACSRQTYILVGLLTAIFLGGGFGIHNFIAGRTQTAIIQLVLCVVGWGLLLCTFGISSVINLAVIVWTIIEVCTVTTDGRNQRMP